VRVRRDVRKFPEYEMYESEYDDDGGSGHVGNAVARGTFGIRIIRACVETSGSDVCGREGVFV
jgi:hypothetical protein